MERLVFREGEPVPDVAFTHGAQWVVNQAREFGGLPLEGKGSNDEAHVGTEHIALSLALQPEIQLILPAQIPLSQVTADLTDYIKDDPNIPPTDDDGYTPTVVQAFNNARLLAARDNSEVTPIHLFAGMIEAGRGKGLMVFGKYMGYAEDNASATPLIQAGLFTHIPNMRISD